VTQTRMRERFRQQKRIPKFVTDAVFERIHGERKPTQPKALFQKRSTDATTVSGKSRST
jgi:hypothetical protein